MITFACKKIRLDEIVRCSFSLNKTEYNMLMFLLRKEKEFDIHTLSKKMGLERTTLQKALKKLLDKKLVKRRQVNIKTGGYFFLYNVKNKDSIKMRLLEIIRQWEKTAEEEIQII